MTFKEWLIKEHANAPGAKQAYYPVGYGGIGLYSMPDYMNWAADAVTFIPPQNRFLKFNWGEGPLSNPFGKNSLYARTENKMAKQIEAGTLKASGIGFEKSNEYVRTIPPEGGIKKELVTRKENYLGCSTNGSISHSET